MKSRLIASAALGALVLVGTTGCAMISTQATTIQYSAADGVNVFGSGPLDVRNAFLVTNVDGADGNLVAAIVNDTDQSATLRLEVGDGRIPATVRVPANTTVSLGDGETEPLLIEGIDTAAGADIPVFFQSGDAEGTLEDIPVLDGTLSYLVDLAPPGAPASNYEVEFDENAEH